jgi:hypothetical protein
MTSSWRERQCASIPSPVAAEQMAAERADPMALLRGIVFTPQARPLLCLVTFRHRIQLDRAGSCSFPGDRFTTLGLFISSPTLLCLSQWSHGQPLEQHRWSRVGQRIPTTAELFSIGTPKIFSPQPTVIPATADHVVIEGPSPPTGEGREGGLLPTTKAGLGRLISPSSLGPSSPHLPPTSFSRILIHRHQGSSSTAVERLCILPAPVALSDATIAPHDLHRYSWESVTPP